jgi:disulfide bond formation protein DsbB
MDTGTLFTQTIAFATLLGNAVFLGLFALYFVARPLFALIKKKGSDYALLCGFLIATASTVGSLLYSEVVGYPACILCWTQRIFMYPLLFLFGLALYRRDRGIIPYALLLASLGAIVASYQWVKDMLAVYTHVSIPCPAVTALPSCDKIYVLEHGYITIPMFALNAFLYIVTVCIFALIENKKSVAE